MSDHHAERRPRSGGEGTTDHFRRRERRVTGYRAWPDLQREYVRRGLAVAVRGPTDLIAALEASTSVKAAIAEVSVRRATGSGARRGTEASGRRASADGATQEGAARIGRAEGVTVNLNTGTVRLVDRRTRVVEVLGPEPPGSRRATDGELPLDTYQSMMDRPQRIGFCFEAAGRGAKFLIDEDRGAINCSTCSPDTPRPRRAPCGRMGPKGGCSMARLTRVTNVGTRLATRRTD